MIALVHSRQSCIPMYFTCTTIQHNKSPGMHASFSCSTEVYVWTKSMILWMPCIVAGSFSNYFTSHILIINCASGQSRSLLPFHTDVCYAKWRERKILEREEKRDEEGIKGRWRAYPTACFLIETFFEYNCHNVAGNTSCSQYALTKKKKFK